MFREMDKCKIGTYDLIDHIKQRKINTFRSITAIKFGDTTRQKISNNKFELFSKITAMFN